MLEKAQCMFSSEAKTLIIFGEKRNVGWSEPGELDEDIGMG